METISDGQAEAILSVLKSHRWLRPLLTEAVTVELLNVWTGRRPYIEGSWYDRPIQDWPALLQQQQAS